MDLPDTENSSKDDSSKDDSNNDDNGGSVCTMRQSSRSPPQVTPMVGTTTTATTTTTTLQTQTQTLVNEHTLSNTENGDTDGGGEEEGEEEGEEGGEEDKNVKRARKRKRAIAQKYTDYDDMLHGKCLFRLILAPDKLYASKDKDHRMIHTSIVNLKNATQLCFGKIIIESYSENGNRNEGGAGCECEYIDDTKIHMNQDDTNTHLRIYYQRALTRHGFAYVCSHVQEEVVGCFADALAAACRIDMEEMMETINALAKEYGFTGADMSCLFPRGRTSGRIIIPPELIPVILSSYKSKTNIWIFLCELRDSLHALFLGLSVPNMIRYLLLNMRVKFAISDRSVQFIERGKRLREHTDRMNGQARLLHSLMSRNDALESTVLKQESMIRRCIKTFDDQFQEINRLTRVVACLSGRVNTVAETQAKAHTATMTKKEQRKHKRTQSQNANTCMCADMQSKSIFAENFPGYSFSHHAHVHACAHKRLATLLHIEEWPAKSDLQNAIDSYSGRQDDAHMQIGTATATRTTTTEDMEDIEDIENNCIVEAEQEENTDTRVNYAKRKKRKRLGEEGHTDEEAEEAGEGNEEQPNTKRTKYT